MGHKQYMVQIDMAKYTLQIVCSVPDLIAVLDSQNGASIGTQDYRYGLRVTVIGLACDPRWASAEGLEIGGPEAFGYVVTKLYMCTSNKLNSDNFNLLRMGLNYVPIAEYIAPKSVIDEYR